ncbi:serine carboxypeptidase-like 17 [Cynara cardunculus var. scolymus]|uniref:serine carboxypeptidase-like 17 n=1 Tax=Cynara cardunculus var. scolymus TaxID=59895 RepID=UPI000D628885|nr:serine carboxypeptidase-like 17 [Cynara cardunculus var. scolymus]
MKSKYMMISLFIIFLQFITSSCSQSTVKNLPSFNGDLPFTLQTGYIGMGEEDAMQVFYYFVESERNPSEDPLFLYFAGGPGASGLYPFLYQNGPLSFNFESSKRGNITLELNPYSWSKVANVIFVDLPIGVGFSYAKTWEASRSSDSLLAVQGYEFLRKWLVENPRFVSNPLYVSGISYMGIIVPNVALEVYKGNELGNQPQVNIKGYLIINPLTDKFIDFNSRFEYAHRLALISDDIYESTKASCDGDYVYNVPENSLCADNLKRVAECTSRIKFGFILEPVCNVTDRVPTCKDFTDTFIQTWVNSKGVQKALNIHEGTIGKWEYANTSIAYDLKKNDTVYYSYDVWSTIESHKQLLTKNCQALIMCADHDMVFPYLGTEKWIKNLNLPIENAWEPWFVRTQVAGYQMTYARRGSSIQFATVKGAGHALAMYKPEEALALMDRWLASHAYLSFSS